MPIYDYACGACGHTVEVIHGIHDGGPRFCPSCGVDGRMKKAFHAPTVHFKGSGWAKKDRSTASAARSKRAEPAGGADAADGAKSTSTADGASGSGGDTKATTAAPTPAPASSNAGSTGPTTGGE